MSGSLSSFHRSWQKKGGLELGNGTATGSRRKFEGVKLNSRFSRAATVLSVVDGVLDR